MFGKNKENLREKITDIVEKTEMAGQGGKTAKEAGAVGKIDESEDGRIDIQIKGLSDRQSQVEFENDVRSRMNDANLPQAKLRLKYAAGSSTPPKVATTTINPSAPPTSTISKVKKVFAVGSGKGGVGKSTVTINLAATLAKEGYRVGVLDADIYGPSIGKMVGMPGRQQVELQDEKIIPLDVHGMRVMSFAFLIEESQPVIWRASMLNKAMNQLLLDVEWGELDYMIIDLPPGTGDTQLNLSQLVKTDGAIVVTTPQNVAIQDATRAVNMFDKVNIPVTGIIENMSEFICPHCGKSSHIFSEGGGDELSKMSGTQLLGRVPLTTKLMQSGEKGEPLVLSKEDDPVGVKPVQEAYDTIVKNFLSLTM